MCSTRSTRMESSEELWNRVMLSGWRLCKVGQIEMEWVSLPVKHIATVSTPSITIQLLPDYHQIPLAITPSPCYTHFSRSRVHNINITFIIIFIIIFIAWIFRTWKKVHNDITFCMTCDSEIGSKICQTSVWLTCGCYIVVTSPSWASVTPSVLGAIKFPILWAWPLARSPSQASAKPLLRLEMGGYKLDGEAPLVLPRSLAPFPPPP